MSGYKMAAITVTAEDIARLYETDGNGKSLPEPSIEMMGYISLESKQILETNLENLQTRHEAFDSLLSTISSGGEELQAFETNTDQALSHFETDFASQVDQMAGEIWEHFDQILAEYAEAFDQRIQANYLEARTALAEVSQQIEQIHATNEEKGRLAGRWLEIASQLCAHIKQYYPYRQFTPGRLEWLERQLEQARINYGSGFFEAAVAASQQVYFSLSELRVELERSQAEWTFLYQAAWEAINRLLIRTYGCQEVDAVDLQGNLLNEQIQVDYWSEGQLSELYEKGLAIRDQVAAADPLPDQEALRGWLDQTIPQLHGELENLVLQARINALNSQLRINVADLVVRALQEQGFDLDESEYAESDMRMSYGAHLTSPEGSSVTVRVAPVGDGVGENELHLQSTDHIQRTEHEYKQRWYEVSRSLNRYGVGVGPYQRPDLAPRERHPISAIRLKERKYGYRADPQEPAERR